MRKITGIIIHCTATNPDFMSGRSTQERVDEVRRWHVSDNGWSDIGYHYLIDRDGTIATGRPMEKMGAHVRGQNKGTVGIALFGGRTSTTTDAFSDNFTRAQETSLKLLIDQLKETFGNVNVSGHNQYANKACPGFDAAAWFASTTRPVLKAPPVMDPPASEPEAAIHDRSTPWQSTTIWAQIRQWAAQMVPAGIAVWAGVKEQDPIVQAAIVGSVAVVALYIIHQGKHIIKERMEKWDRGIR